jgi:type II secretory pathway component PulL
MGAMLSVTWRKSSSLFLRATSCWRRSNSADARPAKMSITISARSASWMTWRLMSTMRPMTLPATEKSGRPT